MKSVFQKLNFFSVIFLVGCLAAPLAVLEKGVAVEPDSFVQEKAPNEFSSEPAPETILLKFAWPKNSTFQVKFNFSENKKRGEQNVGMNMTGTSTVTTESHQKGLKIKYSDTKINTSFSGQENSSFQKKFSEFLVGLGEVDVQYVIGENGDLLDIENFEDYQKRLKDYLDGFLKMIPKSQARIRVLSLFNQLTSKNHLFSQFEKEWNKDVGQWVDSEFEKGAVYEINFEEEAPILNNSKIPFNYQFSYLGRVPCKEGGPENDCVELQMKAEGDPVALAKAVEDFAKGFGGKNPSTSIKSMKINTSLTLVTEPETLLPHHSVFVKKALIESSDGKVSEKTEKSEGIYTYPDSPKGKED